VSTNVSADAAARPRVAILGAGVMGTLFGYYLAEHNDVTLVDVRADVVETINKHGVQIDDSKPRGVVATREPSKVFTTNYLFVFVKAPYTLGAIRPFAGQLNPTTPIVSLQNGLGNEEAIKAALGANVPLVIGITNVAGYAVGHGRSRRFGGGTTVVGSGGASTATVRSVQTLLQKAGFECSVAYDIRPHLWGKLLANAAINPVSALLEATNSSVVSDPNAAELARNLALEGAAVAKALRVNLPFGDPWEYVRDVITSSVDGRNSMTIDLAARLKTEVDHINGAIVAAGRRTGVATPYNEAVLRLIKAKENVPRE